MDTEEPLDVKSLRERFQGDRRSCTLPAYTKAREEIICNVRDNPALQGVISTLENKAKPSAPPIAKKPELPPKPNGPSRQNSVDMKLGKGFSQKFHVTDPPRTKKDGVCASSPQTYRHSMPTFPDPPPQSDQPPSQVYEDVGPAQQQTPPINDIKTVGSKRPPMPIGPKPMMVTSTPVLDAAKDEKKGKANGGPSIKPLPSIASQGPPPPKPSRPPDVDLSTFFTAESDEPEYDLPPPSPVPSDDAVYDEAFTAKDSTDDNFYEVEDVTVACEPPDAASPAPDASSPNQTDEMSCYQDVVNPQESPYSVYYTKPVSSPETLEECTYEVSADNNDDAENSYSSTMSAYPMDHSPTSEGYYSADFNSSRESFGSKDNKAKEVKLGKNEQEFRKKYKISGQEQMLYTSEIVGDVKPGKNSLPVKKGEMVEVIRITDCPAGKWLVRDTQGNHGFVPLDSLEVSKEIQSFSTQNIFNIPVDQDLYTDIENSGGKSESLKSTDSGRPQWGWTSPVCTDTVCGLGLDVPSVHRHSRCFEAGRPQCAQTLATDSAKPDEQYDDISSVGPALTSPAVKGKVFGNFFKKDKPKKEDTGYSPVVPNQNGFVPPEDQDLYTDVDIAPRNSGGKSDSLRRTDGYSAKPDEQYDDISSVGPALTSPAGKGKGFGNFFKKDKPKKEDTGYSPAVPIQNGFVPPEDQDLYTDVDIAPRNSGGKSDSLRRTDRDSAKPDEQYDDISSVGPALTSSGGKGKGLGNLFKKEKSKKEDTGYAPVIANLNRTTSQEGEEYCTYTLGDEHEREKEEKSPRWSIFSPKRGSERKFFPPTSGVKKFAKEEKIFREKFKYTGEIKILNIATVNDLAPLSPQNKLELDVKPGETVEVVDVTSEDKIICRNFAGKYGYVQIEWLNLNTEIGN